MNLETLVLGNLIIYTIIVIYTVFIGYITYSFLNFLFGKPKEVYIRGQEQVKEKTTEEVIIDKEKSRKMSRNIWIITITLTIVISTIYIIIINM